MQSHTEMKWSRQRTAKYYNCPVPTLATWDCLGKHLKGLREGKEIYYLVSDIQNFLQMPISKYPLLTPEEAAVHIDRSPKSLATWRVKNKHRLNAIKINGLVRYTREALDRFNDDQTRPFVLA